MSLGPGNQSLALTVLRPIFGQLQIGAPVQTHTLLSCIVQDVARFYMLVGLVQMTIYLVTLGPDVGQSEGSAKNALLELLLSVINTARPVLPAVLVFVRIVALVRLRYQGLTVSDTQKMLTAGHLDVVLFDKTGTLTVEQVSKHSLWQQALATVFPADHTVASRKAVERMTCHLMQYKWVL